MSANLSPSLQDGYNGAGDAFILEAYAAVPASVTPETVKVMCTKKTKGLLKRAGFLRTRFYQFYAVPVCRDRFERLQLAPAKEAVPA